MTVETVVVILSAIYNVWQHLTTKQRHAKYSSRNDAGGRQS